MNTDDPPTWYERVLSLHVGPLCVGLCFGIGPYAVPPYLGIGWRGRGFALIRDRGIFVLRRGMYGEG